MTKKLNNVKTITITIQGEEWSTILDNTFKKVRKDLKVDGFRKGAISKEMYIKKFGIKSLYKDAVDEAINTAYEKALNESELNPVCQPSVDIKVIDEFGSSFMVLSLEQYLLVYSSSINDGYRINVRKKKDEEKIKLIKKYLGK